MFRVYLAIAWTALVVFTGVVVMHHGLGLLPVFFGSIAQGTWSGQFNADFLSLLALGGLWCAWRGQWSPVALAHGLLAFFGGGVVIMATLFALHRRYRGDMRKVLLGANA